VLPWRRPDVYNASPIAKYKIAGIPLITVSGVIFGGFLVFCIYKWLFDSAYFINNYDSKLYMLALYAIALVIYVISRVVRRSEGIDLAKINAEIPVE